MKAHTLSVVVGSAACNAKCPMCISKQTMPMAPVPQNEINFRNFEKSCRLARQYDISTALITGKGEPTLDKDTLRAVCGTLTRHFPVIELQTNGYLLASSMAHTQHGCSEDDLRQLYRSGLTTIAISITHYDDELNNTIFQFPTLLKLRELINDLHTHGFTVRLSCMLITGLIDSIPEIEKLVDFCKAMEVEQLTVRPIHAEASEKHHPIVKWAWEHTLGRYRMNEIHTYFDDSARVLLKLAHGATVYDYKGQNLCISTCMTRTTDPDDIRQLIFFPDGHLRYDWVYPGAILI